MLIPVITLIFAVLLGAVYLFFKRSFDYWGKLGFPHTKPSIPWGDVRGLLSKETIADIVTSIYRKFKKDRLVGLWFLFKPNLLIRDPELVKSVFVRDFMSFHDRGIYINEKDDPLSAHLFSISGTKWRNLRVKMTPTFTSGKMKLMFPILVECSKNLKKIVDGPAERGEVVEIKSYAARFTTDIISLVAFGLETDSLNNPDAEFRRYGQMLFELSLFEAIKNIMQFMVPSVPRFFKMRSTRKEPADFFLKAFKESMDYREENNIRRNDFMDLLVQLKKKGKLEGVDGENTDESEFTFEQAAAQAFVFFAAGFETSSTTMQFALYELAKNPDIQERCRLEIKEVLDRHNGEITYDSVNEMDYLGRVIDETLRMYPPLPFLQRECNKDWPVPDTDLVVPKGTTVLIDCFGMQHDEQHFPDPETFDPDRFTEEVKATRHHYTYLPFGEGPRNCIGMRFGLMQTRVGMMTLLTNYELSLSKESPMPIVFDPKSFILAPEGGMHLKITKIKSQ